MKKKTMEYGNRVAVNEKRFITDEALQRERRSR